jgi:hypothetical protein
MYLSYRYSSLICRAYAVEGFGEALHPQDLYFLVVVAGKAGNHHQGEMILGGLAALQTSAWRATT